jgi:4-methyl-5(b-hydroxyethyl)-thiazole monophosphate biosynthesis
MPSALIVLAPGAEEIETITVADLLVRAGVTVTLAATGPRLITGSRGLLLGAGTDLDAVDETSFDLLYLPGGMGSAETCRDDTRVQRLLAARLGRGSLTALICAAPLALLPQGLGRARRLTSFPAVRPQLEPHIGAWIDAPVVRDGHLITSQGVGTAPDLGLVLTGLLTDTATARSTAERALLPWLPAYERCL